MARGWLITFEGGEGTGKSTQLARLDQHLRGRGQEVVWARTLAALPEALR